MRSLAPLAALLATLVSGCSQGGGDKRTPPTPNPIGQGQRMREITDPGSPTRPPVGSVVNCTGLSVVQVDAFDETRDGKSTGTLFVQDVGSHEPYAGVGTFSAAFIPSSLRVAPGDVLDLKGQYQENKNIGGAVFPAGQVLPQLFRPTATFRFEGAPITPTEIDVADLADFAIGRRWLGMLVTVRNVTVPLLLDDGTGRVTGRIMPGDTSNIPTVTNELYALGANDFAADTTFASITGVVTYFFNLHLAPRSANDFVK
jgi:hypothetical protein